MVPNNYLPYHFNLADQVFISELIYALTAPIETDQWKKSIYGYFINNDLTSYKKLQTFLKATFYIMQNVHVVHDSFYFSALGLSY